MQFFGVLITPWTHQCMLHAVCSVFDYDYYYDYLDIVLPDSFSPLLTVSLEVIILEYSSSIAGLIQDVIFTNRVTIISGIPSHNT